MRRRLLSAWIVPALAATLVGTSFLGAEPAKKCPLTGKPANQCCEKKGSPSPPCCQFSCSKEGHEMITALARHGYSRKCPVTGQPAVMCCAKTGGGAPCCQSGACAKESHAESGRGLGGTRVAVW